MYFKYVKNMNGNHAYVCIGVGILGVCHALGVCVRSIGRRPAEYILHRLSGSLRVERSLISSGHKCHLSVSCHSLRVVRWKQRLDMGISVGAAF